MFKVKTKGVQVYSIMGPCDIDKNPARTAARGGGGAWDRAAPKRILKFVVGCFGLDSILLTEGSILDPCYEIWE
jgi:hypothetical protein